MSSYSISDYMKLPCRNLPSTYAEYGGIDKYVLRDETFSEYSPTGYAECRRCGNDDQRVLTLDHVFTDGADSREKLTGDRKIGGMPYYRKLRSLGFPDKHRYQVLCSNCHRIKEYETWFGSDTASKTASEPK